MSKLKEKLSNEVHSLAYYNTEMMYDMTDRMDEIYQWALMNAPIHKLREWKRLFKQAEKERLAELEEDK